MVKMVENSPISFYGLFANPATVRNELVPLMGFFPSDAAGFLVGEAERISARTNDTLTWASIGSLIIALWFANAGTKAVFDALNVAYREKEKRSFVRLNLISFAFTIGSIVFLLLAAGAVIVVPIVLASIGVLSFAEQAFSLLRWPLLLVLIVAGLSLLYRFGPSRRQAKWRWLSIGSVAAATLWLIASGLFSWYLSHLADYNGTYGSLGAAIGLMMWLWLTVIAVLVGAELDAEIEHQTARDSTIGPEKPLGARGAFMADTAGAAQD